MDQYQQLQQQQTQKPQSEQLHEKLLDQYEKFLEKNKSHNNRSSWEVTDKKQQQKTQTTNSLQSSLQNQELGLNNVQIIGNNVRTSDNFQFDQNKENQRNITSTTNQQNDQKSSSAWQIFLQQNNNQDNIKSINKNNTNQNNNINNIYSPQQLTSLTLSNTNPLTKMSTNRNHLEHSNNFNNNTHFRYNNVEEPIQFGKGLQNIVDNLIKSSQKSQDFNDIYNQSINRSTIKSSNRKQKTQQTLNDYDISDFIPQQDRNAKGEENLILNNKDIINDYQHTDQKQNIHQYDTPAQNSIFKNSHNKKLSEFQLDSTQYNIDEFLPPSKSNENQQLQNQFQKQRSVSTFNIQNSQHSAQQSGKINQLNQRQQQKMITLSYQQLQVMFQQFYETVIQSSPNLLFNQKRQSRNMIFEKLEHINILPTKQLSYNMQQQQCLQNQQTPHSKQIPISQTSNKIARIQSNRQLRGHSSHNFQPPQIQKPQQLNFQETNSNSLARSASLNKQMHFTNNQTFNHIMKQQSVIAHSSSHANLNMINNNSQQQKLNFLKKSNISKPPSFQNPLFEKPDPNCNNSFTKFMSHYSSRKNSESKIDSQEKNTQNNYVQLPVQEFSLRHNNNNENQQYEGQSSTKGQKYIEKIIKIQKMWRQKMARQSFVNQSQTSYEDSRQYNSNVAKSPFLQQQQPQQMSQLEMFNNISSIINTSITNNQIQTENPFKFQKQNTKNNHVNFAQIADKYQQQIISHSKGLKDSMAVLAHQTNLNSILQTMKVNPLIY